MPQPGAGTEIAQAFRSNPAGYRETSGFRRSTPAAIILACALFLSSIPCFLHCAGLFFPALKVEPLQTVILRKNAGETLLAARFPHPPAPRPDSRLLQDYPGQLTIIADGKDLLLKALQSGPLTKENYQIDKGFLCFYAPPKATSFSVTRPVIFKFSGFAGGLLLLLASGTLITAFMLDGKLRELLSSLSKRLRFTGAVVYWSYRQACRRTGAIWAPLFGASDTPKAVTRRGDKLSWKAVSGACLTLGAVVYLNTGTLCPLNLFHPLVVDRGFSTVVNIDHDYHYSLFLLVDGQADQVKPPYNMLFRRVLFPALAYPFMKSVGYIEGGIIAGVLYNLLALFLFSLYVARRWGGRAGTAAAVLLCVYPGYAYFLGLPSCYAIIFPACLGCMVALSEIERRLCKPNNQSKTKETLEIFLLSLGAGILCLGYDVIGFVLPTAVMLCLFKKRWAQSAAVLFGTVLPLALWCGFLYLAIGKESLLNSNTSTFANAILAWKAVFSAEAIWTILNKIPQVFAFGWQTYLGSTFYFLPLLFATCLIAGRFTRDNKLQLCEVLFISTCTALFLFFNLPPDCTSSGLGGQGLAEWQLKGAWTVRLYQPLFAVYVLYISRQLAGLQFAKPGWKLALGTAFVICMTGNALTSFGTFMGNPLGLSCSLFDAFFPGGDRARFQWNLATYGRLPIGFYDCRKAERTQMERDASGKAALTAIRQAIPAR